MNRNIGIRNTTGKGRMPGSAEKSGTEEERIGAADRYLSEYRTTYRMLRAGLSGLYRHDGIGLFGDEHGTARKLAAAHGLATDDDRMWEEKLVSIRATVLAVEDPEEKIFLFQHYIRGNTVETCAEILDISVRTAFRLKKRALLSVSRMI